MTPEQPSPIARAQADRDALAKAWLLKLVERTALEDVDRINLDWVAREAPHLIGDILRALDDPTLADETGRGPASGERAAGLRHLRTPSYPAAQVARDLAMLQALLIRGLEGGGGGSEAPHPAARFESLAEVFGAIQAAVIDELVREPAGTARTDPLTGLPGRGSLDEWMRAMFAAEQRYGTPFSVLLVGMDGLGRVRDAHGRRAGERMLAAVAAVITTQIRAADHAFRLDEDELCVLLPQQGPIPAVPVAERLVSLISGAQGSEEPRVDIAVGVAGCPEHGRDAETLLSKAEEATYAARAAGESVAIAHGARPAWLQDS